MKKKLISDSPHICYYIMSHNEYAQQMAYDKSQKEEEVDYMDGWEEGDEEIPKCPDSYKKHYKCPVGYCGDCDEAREEIEEKVNGILLSKYFKSQNEEFCVYCDKKENLHYVDGSSTGGYYSCGCDEGGIPFEHASAIRQVNKELRLFWDSKNE